MPPQLEDKLLLSFVSALVVFTQAKRRCRLGLCAVAATLALAQQNPPSPNTPQTSTSTPPTLRANQRQQLENFFICELGRKMWQIFIFVQTGARRPHTKRALDFNAVVAGLEGRIIRLHLTVGFPSETLVPVCRWVSTTTKNAQKPNIVMKAGHGNSSTWKPECVNGAL